MSSVILQGLGSSSMLMTQGYTLRLVPYLGRFQRGQRVPSVLETVSIPTSAPTVILSDDETDTPIISYAMPISVADMLHFAFAVPLGSGLDLGTFRLTYEYEVAGGGTLVLTETFDLVDGGDSGGRVISVYGHSGQESSHILAQLDSGKLVQGSGPRL